MVQGESKSALIENAVERRVVDSAAMLHNPEAHTIDGLRIRDYLCRAIPVALLSNPKRVECGGVQYELTLEVSASQKYSMLLNVRVAPHGGSDSAARGKGAYIAVYAVDPQGAEDLITWCDIGERNLYAEVPVSNWYAVWLAEALRHRRSSKLFKYKRALA